jgi:H+/Cl- antiporter ClcA
MYPEVFPMIWSRHLSLGVLAAVVGSMAVLAGAVDAPALWAPLVFAVCSSAALIMWAIGARQAREPLRIPSRIQAPR